MLTILHILLKITINNHPLLYIHINTHNNYHKKYTKGHPKCFTMIPIKLEQKKNFFFLAYIKMKMD